MFVLNGDRVRGETTQRRPTRKSRRVEQASRANNKAAGAGHSDHSFPSPWQTRPMSEASTAQGAPLLYFVAGLLCASIASHLLARPSAKRVGSAVATIGDGEDWDSDDDGPAEVSGPCSAWGISDAPYKMVLCVNTSLSMGKGG